MSEIDEDKEQKLADVVSSPAWVHVVTVLIGLFFVLVIGGVFYVDGIYSNDEVLVKAGVGLDRTFLFGLIASLCVAALVAMTSFERNFGLRRNTKDHNESEG